jgi:hypothetical protein
MRKLAELPDLWPRNLVRRCAFFLLPGFLHTEEQGALLSYRLEQSESSLAKRRPLPRRLRQKMVA